MEWKPMIELKYCQNKGCLCYWCKKDCGCGLCRAKGREIKTVDCDDPALLEGREG